MLAYLSTNEPFAIVGLVMVFVGMAICVPLTLKEEPFASGALVGGWVLTIGGGVLACLPSLKHLQSVNDPEITRDVIRLLLVMAIAVVLSGTMEGIRGYRAGRRGGCRRLVRLLTGW